MVPGVGSWLGRVKETKSSEVSAAAARTNATLADPVRTANRSAQERLTAHYLERHGSRPGCWSRG